MRRHALRRRYGHFGGKGEVIKSRLWRKNTGEGASPYGAVPWTGAPGNRQEDWHMQDVGWTVQWSDGTIGSGRVPFKTREEAQEWLRKHEEHISDARKIQAKYSRKGR